MFQTVLSTLTEGFLKTLELFGLTLAGALPLGLIIAFGSMSPFHTLARCGAYLCMDHPRHPVDAAIDYHLLLSRHVVGKHLGARRGRPLHRLDCRLYINYACYFSEIYRGGIQAVPHGQYEAGQVLGMTRTQTFFRVVLLQVIKHIVPPISNEIITLVKDTSIARVICPARTDLDG